MSKRPGLKKSDEKISPELQLFIEARLRETRQLARDGADRARNQAIGILGTAAVLTALLGSMGVVSAIRRYASEAAENAVAQEVTATYVGNIEKAARDVGRMSTEISALHAKSEQDAYESASILEALRKQLVVEKSPALEGTWTHYESDPEGQYNNPSYYRDLSGIVHLKGLVQGGDGVIFRLEEGFRPSHRELHAAQTYPNAIGRVDVLPSGEVLMRKGNSRWISLDGISFNAVPPRDDPPSEQSMPVISPTPSQHDVNKR